MHRNSINAVLIDLDGVLYEGDRMISGAADTVTWLQSRNIAHLFLTNTTSRPRGKIVEKLAALDIHVSPERILTPVIATTNWLSSHTQGPVALFIPEATKEDLTGVEELPDDRESGAAAVILGDLGEKWSYPVLNRAFRLLMDDPQPPLLALGMTRYWRGPDGLRLDVAPFVKGLEHAAGCKAVVLGKPSGDFFQSALDMLGATADATLMIGDDIVGDIQGAQRSGINAALVKTGKFRSRDLDTGITPDAVLDSVADLPAWWG